MITKPIVRRASAHADVDAEVEGSQQAMSFATLLSLSSMNPVSTLEASVMAAT
jgi:hypothetical protein